MKLELDRDEILDLINCAEDYGFADAVLFDAFAGWLGEIPDEEIAAYAGRFVTPKMMAQGYGPKDRDNALERLTDGGVTHERFQDENCS